MTLGELTADTRPICYGVLKPGDYVENGVPLVRITDISGNYFDDGNLHLISNELDQEFSRSKLKGGEILISIQGTIGRVAICPQKYAGANISRTIAVVEPDERAFKPFVYWFLRYYGQRELFDAFGATRASLNISTLRDLKIPLPPLAEQKRIAAILDKADAIRQKRKQAIELADEFLRSVFLEMFGDPVTNPKGFPIKVLSELYVDPKNGTKCGPFGSALKKEEFVDGGIPVWNMDNISLSGNFKDEPKLWVTEEKFKEIDAYSVTDGDVIISRAGTVGKMGVVRTKYLNSLISTNLIRVRFSEDLLPEYFVALMTYCKGRVGRLKTGPDGSFTHMNTGILDKLEFPYPPIELQEKFLKLLADTERYLDKVSPYQFSELFDSLSQKAFSGQI